MDDTLPTDPQPLTSTERRAFLKRARNLAIAAPATTLLLEAATKPAHASSYQPVPPPTSLII